LTTVRIRAAEVGNRIRRGGGAYIEL